MLNANFRLKDKGYSNSDDAANLPRHRWYKVKESFSPSLFFEALESVSSDEVCVVDPFAGSGTVPLAAAELGCQAIGMEVNPFLQFVSVAKLSQCHVSTLRKHRAKVDVSIKKGKISPLEGFSTFTESKKNSGKWLFNTSVIRAFESGRRVAEAIGYPPARRLVQLALIGAAMDVSNAYKEGKCLRYRKNWHDRRFGGADFRSAFEARMHEIEADLETNPIREMTGEVQNADCRAALNDNPSFNFDLCVTSPPYLNSFDYTDIYRPELFLGGFVRSMEELRRLRLKTIRSHVQAKWPDPLEANFGAVYGATIAQLLESKFGVWDRRIPMMVQAYFEDMHRVLTGLKKRAKKGAQAWLIVSTSAYGGVELPVDLILAEIATKVGWTLREIGVLRQLRSASQHWTKGGDGRQGWLRESAVILSA